MDPAQFKEISKDPDYYTKYEADKKQLETAMQDWEKLSMKIEQKTAELNTLQ